MAISRKVEGITNYLPKGKTLEFLVCDIQIDGILMVIMCNNLLISNGRYTKPYIKICK